MDLELNFDSYDLEELNTVLRNVDNDYFRTESKLRCIQRIERAFTVNLDNILRFFYMENEELSKDFIARLFGGKVCSENLSKLKLALKRWGMCDETGEIFATLGNKLIDRYREKYIVSDLPIHKIDCIYPLHLELILFVYDIYTKEFGQAEILENTRKNIGRKNSDFIIEYLQVNKYIYLNPVTKQFYIQNDYIDELMLTEKNSTIAQIRSIIKFICEKINYKDYIDDLFKICRIQRNSKYWIDISNLDIVNTSKLNLLKQLGLVNLYLEEGKTLLSLTNISFEILGYDFNKENLECHNYYAEEENKIIVPYNYDIFQICNLLMNKKYKLIERDILLIFNKGDL